MYPAPYTPWTCKRCGQDYHESCPVPEPEPQPCPGCYGTGRCYCDDCSGRPGAGHPTCEWCDGTGELVGRA